MEKETEKMDRFVILPTTIARLLKQYSGLTRIERAASWAASEAADEFLHKIMHRIIDFTIQKGEKTISPETVAFVTKNNDTKPRNWLFSKTRLRDRIKCMAGNLRINLESKVILCNAFDDYLELLAERISVTQKLCKRNTISQEHILAAINFR
jgi:histone H3/H4